jgi:glutamate synthase domain-containing protein 2
MDLLFAFFRAIPWWVYPILVLALIAIRDIFFNRRHTIKHNYPVVGHLRYLLEKIGPEMRQYIVASNREELPFNRSARSWIYASAKKQNNYSGFGTDQDQYKPGFPFIKPALFTWKAPEGHPNRQDPYFVPSAKVMGLGRRARPYRPRSIVNISAMSYGSLSAAAVESLNKGAHLAGCYHNTGEGGLSPYHRTGSDVMFHFGTGYFGVRAADGSFSMEKMKALVKDNPQVRAIEVKLSQGAKPGKGGVLPAAKITKEVAAIRGIPLGQDALSPTYHSAFTNVVEMVEFIEAIAAETGLPVGIKAAVGKTEQWEELAELMARTGRGPDFITIDGGEGGTGAAPPAFADHVALPFVFGFAKVYTIFRDKGLNDRLVFIGSGKLGFPASSLMAFSLGCDLIHVAREAMMSIGCIQAQVCHTNKCPAGIATQSKWLQAGIDVTLKSERFRHYAQNLRKEILEITHAAGYEHPAQMTMDDIEISMGDNNHTLPLREAFGYTKQEVANVSVQAMKECPYLGGIAKA